MTPLGKAGPHAVTFIFITVLIDMIGLGLIIPVLPGIIRELTSLDLAGAAAIGGWLAFSYGLMQFVFGPLMGGISDAYGRRPVLLLSLLGLGIDYLLTAFAPTILFLFIGRILAGFFGASYVTANAYIADVTKPEDRGKAFGLLGAAFGLGFVLGPAIGGLLGEYGHRVPFFVAAGLALLNVAYGYFVLPETLPPERRRPLTLARANPFGTLLQFSRIRGLSGLASIEFLNGIGHTVYPAVWAYHTMQVFGWSESMVGASLAFYGIMTAIVQGGLTGPIISSLGERRSAVLGLGAGIAALAAFGVAPAGWMMFAIIMIACLEGIAQPALRAMMSARVGADAQGELQGGLSSLQNIASIIGVIGMSQLFGVFGRPEATPHLPGMPFFAAAALGLVSLAILVATRAASDVRREKEASRA